MSQLDFPHYSELARYPWSNAAPYRGAHCMRLKLSGGTADAFVSEGDMNIAANGQSFYRFYLYFSSDFTGTADDTVHLFELQGAANAIQVVFGFRIVAATDVINLGIGELAPTSWGGPIERNTWYSVELDVTLDDGGSNDGTIDLYVTKGGSSATNDIIHAAQVASLDQIAVTHGVLGVQNHLATTTGTILMDEFINDDARIYPITDQYSKEMLLTKSGHVFVGGGTLENVSLLSGAGTDCVLTVYDTATASTLDAGNIKTELKNTANNEIVDPAGMPVRPIVRGCYITLAGTNPRALVQTCPRNFSTALVRAHGVAN